MPNALIFDVDGVLADTEPIAVRTLNQTFKELCNIDLCDEDSLAYMGATTQKHMSGLVETFSLDADVNELIEHHESLFIKTITQKSDLAIPESISLLKRIALDEEWSVGLATSSTRNRSEESIRACGIDETHLNAWLTGNDITKPKPNPEIYIACALSLGIPPNRCVVIEDSVAGITAAKAAGMACIALEGTFPGEALREADRIVDSLANVDRTMLYDLIHEAAEATK